MISILNGRVIEVLSDSLVVGIGGVGLQVFVPVLARERLRPGDEVVLQTYLVVRQDALNLYGFETRDERELFILLLQVDGIGPKSGNIHPRPRRGSEDCPEDLAPAARSHSDDSRSGARGIYRCRYRSDLCLDNVGL
jgi:hypothetical protein